MNPFARRVAAAVAIVVAAAGFLLVRARLEAHTVHPVAGARTLSNLTYRRVDGEELELDAYLPLRHDRPTAGVVLIHGGGWQNGDKSLYASFGASLARLGWAAFAVNYRLARRAHFPAGLSDVRHAVAWIRAHAARFGIDPRRIAALGDSAGGNLAALVATAGRGSLETGSRVRAAVTWSAPTDLTTFAAQSKDSGWAQNLLRSYIGCAPSTCGGRYRAASPVGRVDPTDAPIFVANSTDELVPLRQARAFDARLRSAGVRDELLVVPGKRHGAAYAAEALVPSLQFLEKSLGPLPNEP